MRHLPHVLFLTARHRSLGETHTAARFASELARDGWGVDFLAFEFAAAFLEKEGFRVTRLGEKPSENRRALERLVRERSPELVAMSDFYLLASKDTSQVWSNRWLFETGLPVVSFDHLKYHPRSCDLDMAFLGRFDFESRAGSLPGSPRLPRGRRPKSSRCHVDPLPAEVSALVRPCPAHDPEPEEDPRVFKYQAVDAPVADPRPSAAAARAALGIGERERLVLVPVGSWAVQICRALDIPYYPGYFRLLRRYFEGLPGELRLLALSGELPDRLETHGRLTVQLTGSVPFRVAQGLLRAASLVVCDNVISSFLGRAVLEGVPAAALVSSVSADYSDGAPRFEAPFPLSGFAAELLRQMETDAPGTVFPFSVFPLGWRRETAPLLAGNRYCMAIEQLELFDERGAREEIEKLLFDRTHRRRLAQRQAAYREAVEGLPKAPAIVRRILENNATAKGVESWV